jgi:c(7)-type cytochrome triheme protein
MRPSAYRSVHAVVALGLCLSCSAGSRAAQWETLATDGIHDPESPAIRILQQPREALSRLPADAAGNQVRWVEALEKGLINPRTNIHPETKVRTLDLDIVLNKRGSLPLVKFPHRQHTAWLDCTICHDQLFKAKAGANRFSMMLILQGEQCGLCHGAVAFPLTECNRCHSVRQGAVAPPTGATKADR